MTAFAGGAEIAAQLRDLARAVRRIGDGRHADPEAIAEAKDEIATRLAGLARAMERTA